MGGQSNSPKKGIGPPRGEDDTIIQPASGSARIRM